VVWAGLDQTAGAGSPISFTGIFTEPGVLDTFTITWDFGDGNSSGDTLTPTHTYEQPGSYTVTLTVSDDDTGTGSDTLLVTVTETGYRLYLPVMVGQQTAVPPDTLSLKSGFISKPGKRQTR
jgi:PKD repeat protein